MKTHANKLLFMLKDFGWLTFLVAILGVASIVGLIHTQNALAAQSASDYCAKYTANTEKNACKEGINGVDCFTNWGWAGQERIDICTKAKEDTSNGIVTPGDVTVPASPNPSPSASPSPTTSPSLPQLKDLQDQAKELEKYIDTLHEVGEEATGDSSLFGDTSGKDDTKLDAYVNGAGDTNPITTLKAGTGNSPAILFFNGGGWHTNDKAGEYVAGVPPPNGLYDNTGAENAGDRGYAMYDVEYRLGSSGVYYMFEDVMRGIQHMRNNAAAYQIDPNKIVIWGDSAGGSLAVRAAASGKSGAKAAVGWSAPTNGYTALFKSIQTFGVGMDHSTCIPTDLAGFANFANLATGGSGDVAKYGQGLSSNNIEAFGISLDGSSTGSMNPLILLTQGLTAGKNLMSAFGDVESISKQISSGGLNSLSGSAMNIASKKFAECIDNFNVLSPALFASPDTPPTFLAEFEDDGLVDPSQSYGMRDKLRQLGIKSDALVLPGSKECMESAAAPFGAGGCHLGYFKDFVCPTLNFIDSIVQPERGETNCGTGVAENAINTSDGAGSGPGGDSNNNDGASPADNLNPGNCPQGYVMVDTGGCRVTDRSKDPSDAGNLNPGNCPQGYVIDSSGGCRVIDHGGGKGGQSQTPGTVDSKGNPVSLPRVPGSTSPSSVSAARPALTSGRTAIGGNVYVDSVGNRVAGPSGALNDLGWADDAAKSSSKLSGAARWLNPEVGLATTLIGDTPLGNWTLNCMFGNCGNKESGIYNGAYIPNVTKFSYITSIMGTKR